MVDQVFDLHQIVFDVNCTTLFAVAAWTLLVYDHLITIWEEIEVIWKSPWGFVKVVYIWNRYFGFLTLTLNAYFRLHEMKTDKICAFYMQAIGFMATTVVCTVDLVLMLRVWALYGCRRLLLCIFVPLITAQLISMIFISVIAVINMAPYIHVGPAVPGFVFS